jgi:HAD superfamily hydrolase (TIGR01509 family)
MTVQAVLFDCDGVLVDSEPTGFDVLGEEFSAHGHPMDREAMEQEFVGSTIAALADRARDMGVGFGPTWVDDFYEKLYARLGEGTDLMPGIERFLDRLDAAGISYAVGSNGTTRKMEVTLGQHPRIWTRLKDHLFSGQEIGAPKPAPDLYFHAARSLGADPKHCVVIEDSVTGARAGIAAGMRVLGYAPQGGGTRLAEVGAEVIASYEEAAARLGLYHAA